MKFCATTALLLVLLFTTTITIGFEHSLSSFGFGLGLGLGANFNQCASTGFNTTSVMIPARDGTLLYTRIVFPYQGEMTEPLSVVLERTPYGADVSTVPTTFGATFCRIGISQDFRGRFKSQGSFEFWRDAASDGYDTQQWITNQPWSNGNVFSVGMSAPAIAAYMQPMLSPQWLKSAYLAVGVPDVYSTLYQQGTYRESLTNGWLNAIGEPSTIPIVEKHEPFSSWWESTDMTPYYSHFNFPTIHYSGWYDIFLQHSLDGWQAFRERNPNTTVLIMGPDGHCNQGDVPHPDNTSFVYSVEAALTLWTAIETVGMNGTLPSNYVFPYPSIYLYVLGPGTPDSVGNFFMSLYDWPKAEEFSLYLAPNSVLSLEPPNQFGSTSYIFDPSNPVPTLGGANLLIECGPRDQRPVLKRSDVLYFTTVPMTANVAITGRMWLDLYVSSNCTDTDFTAKLLDVYPDGRAILLTDNALRMRWRNNPSQISLMAPGTIYNISIDLTTTSYILNKGHSLAVAISSSNSPRFSVNPNNGRLITEGGPTFVANNTIYYGNTQYPSRIRLPIVTVEELLKNKI